MSGEGELRAQREVIACDCGGWDVFMTIEGVTQKWATNHRRACPNHRQRGEGQPDPVSGEVPPFAAIGDGERPQWGNDRTCPECGTPDLPLHDSEPLGLTFTTHCGKSWLRGPVYLEGRL